VYTDPASAIVVFLLSVAAFWLLVFTAVSSGVGHALDRTRPRLTAEAHVSSEGVHFVVTNVGTGSAFDVTVRWPDSATGEPLARTQLLSPNGRLEWTLPVARISGEMQSIRTLNVGWANGIEPSAGRQFKLLAVLVPSPLGPAV
jgi:hypothetical protein